MDLRLNIQSQETGSGSHACTTAAFQSRCFDQSGNIVNHHDQQIEGDSGLVIPFSEYRRQVESALIRCLTTKAYDWRYEQEVRYIFDLKEHGAALRVVNGKHFLPIPETSLREVIVGFRASYAMVERIVNLYHSGNIGQPKLFFSGCHPYLVEVQKHETNPQ